MEEIFFKQYHNIALLASNAYKTSKALKMLRWQADAGYHLPFLSQIIFCSSNGNHDGDLGKALLQLLIEFKLIGLSASPLTIFMNNFRSFIWLKESILVVDWHLFIALESKTRLFQVEV
jgi:hypothetical protein